jgi:hypothetical protein
MKINTFSPTVILRRGSPSQADNAFQSQLIGEMCAKTHPVYLEFNYLSFALGFESIGLQKRDMSRK